jgi:hypothetical protein
MICIEKDRVIELLTQASHQSRDLTGSDERTFALGHADYDWNLQLLCRGEDRLQENKI